MILIITNWEDEKCKGTEESRKEENRIDDKIDNRSNNDPSNWLESEGISRKRKK